MPEARRQDPYYLAFPTRRSIRGRLREAAQRAEHSVPARRAPAPVSPIAATTSSGSPAQRLAAYLRSIDR